ncbi:PPC domain-containing DNA-binding protein [Pseudoduganella sp. LjRoot289]|uniref:PPC domain-containing DNA-binding protein n=1 Tax=Pseudoduganella sp. LjRoot289 TaxID=3342314 RepID=UPI003F5055C4
MLAHPLRLGPGADLRAAIETAVAEACAAMATAGGAAGEVARGEARNAPDGREAGRRWGAFVLQGIGSLSVAQLRFAGMPHATELRGDLEILTLAGSVAPDGAHLHISVADAEGQVTGGHVLAGCIVRTTAELMLALLPGHAFSRETDPASGYQELVVRTLG